MTYKTKVAILGAGQIGRAVYKIITNLRSLAESSESVYYDISAFVIDSSHENILKLKYGNHVAVDIASSTSDEIAKILLDSKATHVINALPFIFNEKVAQASLSAKCSYIDFTEDDVMADAVQAIYKDSGLSCAVKCGLAPGFINYIGYSLVEKINNPNSLMISVGALPRSVSFDRSHPEQSYNLTWSIDGLVNEYIRPCRVRKQGKEMEVPALGGTITVIIDGMEYEAAYTSGGVGSLVKDLTNVPNVQYMTLRYPGHYKYVREVVQENHGDFEKIKQVFSKTFSYTDDDVIVVYANALGKDSNGMPVRKSYSNKFYGVDDLTGIQATTASSGVAMLEMMLEGTVGGIIDHSKINLQKFTSTQAVSRYYRTTK